jgi:hypothetical protein
MAKKRSYIAVNVPNAWEQYLLELLAEPNIQKNLELGGQTNTYSGLGAWIIWEFLVNNTSMRFQHLNTKENHITIIDNQIRRTVDIYPKEPNELWCEYDQANDCDHVKYALTIEEVRKVLTKKGWELPDM